ncbi:MT-A70-domain-containing protein [Mycena indigotica]|uniref:mRNA m(6)A methyltransferase n=1 Tax=Mycena indigotica TaxID=2126181 RepID=A0A8H6SKW0_9AGAR|nr:MT-A70-domain-containing protein [Mycena indigotica]KAF7301483.1 MT-A70-domain-containing protein [Mycena indigotica]
MTDNQKTVAAFALHKLLTSGAVSAPITATQLLVKVITTPIPEGLLANTSSPPRFRLTDLALFESILESFSPTWEHGTLSLAREHGTLTVMDVTLQGATQTALGESLNPRKRKRVIDDEADSAAGDSEPENSSFDAQLPTTLGSLSKELQEVYALMQKGTAKSRLLSEQFRSPDESTFEPICPRVTKDECAKARMLETGNATICNMIHFRPLIRAHTDPTLGHCSYLNTCYSEPTYAQSPSIPPFPGTSHSHGHAPPNSRGPLSLPSGLGAGGRGKDKAPCRYLHYEVDWDPSDGERTRSTNGTEKKKHSHRLAIGMGPTGKFTQPLPPQWINCDVRRFDYSVLGKFHVIMADPPWDIHMSLPYGTMTDDEMRAMPIPTLQDEGLLFLWVTGRAMEVGRECLKFWGYTRVDEVIWVKTNQLQRVIRTGRTGHWLNHTKEHMLVGVKTVVDAEGKLVMPAWANRGVDTDVIVSEVRETSRKPDEVYNLIERMCPGGRKIEIFGRKHNTRPGWITLGNQLGADQIYEEDLAARIKAKYPERLINTPTTV